MKGRAFKLLAVGLALLLGISFASATIIETEDNGTVATADPISRGSIPWADIGICILSSSSDVDYFSIDLYAGEVLSVMTTPLTVYFERPDAYIELIDTDGSTILTSSTDPDGNSIRYDIDADGTYYLKIYNTTGETGSYQLLVGIAIPEPATLIPLFLGGAVYFISRRRPR